MKKLMFCIVVMALASFFIVGCTDRDSLDENSELPKEMNQQEQPNNQFVEYKGQVAMITEDVILRDPYVITVDPNNNPIYQKLENEEFLLNKNDMVIVIEEYNNECRIVQAFGDIPRIRGTIEKSKLSYDKSLFRDNANQAIVNDVMSYDGVDGNEKGIQYGAGVILERKEGWARVSIPMEESDLWFKLENLSFEFDTSVIDITHD